MSCQKASTSDSHPTSRAHSSIVSRLPISTRAARTAASWVRPASSAPRRSPGRRGVLQPGRVPASYRTDVGISRRCDGVSPSQRFQRGPKNRGDRCRLRVPITRLGGGRLEAGTSRSPCEVVLRVLTAEFVPLTVLPVPPFLPIPPLLPPPPRPVSSRSRACGV